MKNSNPQINPNGRTGILAAGKPRASLVSGIGCLILCFSTTSFAQNYSIDWYKIAGGGGTSTGGVYSVSGTIGQHDAAGPMTGGNYSLTGGFWSLFAVQSPGAPTLRI